LLDVAWSAYRVVNRFVGRSRSASSGLGQHAFSLGDSSSELVVLPRVETGASDRVEFRTVVFAIASIGAGGKQVR
jgi:hypothetical protein